MRTRQPSLTAENNAVLRALESMRPAAARICQDPYAEHFISAPLRQAEDRYRALVERTAPWTRLFPGVCEAILARTRFIDDCLGNALEKGVRQLIILGAGYDTRALRFDRLKDRATVFELDHPDTQRVKLQKFRDARLPVPGHVVFVPIDFDAEAMGRKLSDNGYDTTLKSLFIWEGLTYYLPAAAIDQTLSFISTNSATGSSVVFDYLPSPVVNGTADSPEAGALCAALKGLGEEVVFGLDPDRLTEFLDRHGFELLENITSKEYQRIYLGGPKRHRIVSDIFVFAHARIR